MHTALRSLWTPLVMGMALGGCSMSDDAPGSEPADDPFACAALISAADRLMLEGKVERDPEMVERALLAMMTYFNHHFVPLKIGEKEAFAQVHAERDGLVAALPAADIVARAKTCIERMPPS